ncbi:MAG: uroporphyrinogen decarboxylase family protein [Lachnospiraceae bacterium]|nr:uroporphyrinogen decarboxylase family protein [Lachnospiraceae bacterium]
MEEMTSLERVTAYRSGKAVDRLPYSMGLGETIVNYYGYTNKEYLFSSQIMVDVESKILHEFGGDGMTFSINTRAFAEALGSKMRYVDCGYSTIEKYFLDINPVDNFDSVDIYTAGRLSILLEAVKMAQERYGTEQPIGFSVPCPMNCALGIISLEKLLICMLKKPEMYIAIMDYCLKAILECVRVFYSETGIVPGIFEVNLAKGIMSQRHVNTYVLPYVKKTMEGIQKITGRLPGYGSCGSNEHMWDALLELGFKSLGIDADDDIKQAKLKIGAKASISGNIDAVFLRDASQKEIIQNVYACIRNASDSKEGYTLGIGGGPMAFGTPIKNIKTYSIYEQKFGRGAQKGRLCDGVMCEV